MSDKTLALSEALVEVDDEETELDKILQLLLDPANIHHNTELNRNEIMAFSVLSPMARKYKLQVLQEFLAENMVLRVSKSRGGRKEWVKILSTRMGGGLEDEPRRKWTDYFKRR